MMKKVFFLILTGICSVSGWSADLIQNNDPSRLKPFHVSKNDPVQPESLSVLSDGDLERQRYCPGKAFFKVFKWSDLGIHQVLDPKQVFEVNSSRKEDGEVQTQLNENPDLLTKIDGSKNETGF